jgi:cyclopropane-fatty-acyl-phospholipid synthase
MTTTVSSEELDSSPAFAVPRPFRSLHRLLDSSGLACEAVLPSGHVLRFGDEPPRFRLRLHSDEGFGGPLTQLALARAYVDGHMDIELSMLDAFDLRTRIPDAPPVGLLAKFWLARLFRPMSRENAFAIMSHYNLGDDFYLSFIDQRWRFYSHGLFQHEAESLEDASEHKLERMYASLRLAPGMRLLDIGAGWGGVEQYCGERGVHVTGLTIAPDSHAYVSRLAAQRQLPVTVHLEDFLNHRPTAPYDAIVIYGVIEHIPNYRTFARRVWDCLKPGGRLYLDASASREKYSVSAFSRRYIWPGTHTFLCLQDLTRELLYHGLDVVEVKNETRDYELTMRHWAERFDAARDTIVARWGEQTYRAFRLYLWGGSRGFQQDLMQAYSVVAERRSESGPRPGWVRRGFNAVKGVV